MDFDLPSSFPQVPNLLLNQYGKPMTAKRETPRAIRARYDSAATNDDNRRHWANADSLSAVAANSAHVRKRLRERSRYEVANNSYARGILNTLSAYTVGAGPTLQLTYRGNDESIDPAEMRKATQRVEQLWADWAYVRKLAQKLSTMQLAIDCDGEAFAMTTSATRPSMQTPVQLDVRLYECDHFESQYGSDDAGVKIAASGEPIEYAFSVDHPGDNLSIASSNWISADQVIHLFRTERPGQLRGIPRTTPALPLFAMLRRFTLATLTAAETAADFAAILYGDASAEEGDAIEPWATVEIARGAMLAVPSGQSLAQLKAEHPNATYDEFVKAILREIARCLGVPAVLAIGDASSYNYSSGRLDMQAFNRGMEIDRAILIERDCLDRLLELWLDEALLIDGFLPDIFAQHAADFEWAWRWASPGHVDRAKEASGQQIELTNNTTTLAREYARQGLDWETELRQRARELSVMRELGITPEQSMPQQSQNDPTLDPANAQADDDDDDPVSRAIVAAALRRSNDVLAQQRIGFTKHLQQGAKV